MVDSALLASRIAAVRDAVTRVRSVLPESVDAFIVDRTAREVVALNLLIGIQSSPFAAAPWSVASARLPGPGDALSRRSAVAPGIRWSFKSQSRSLVATQVFSPVKTCSSQTP